MFSCTVGEEKPFILFYFLGRKYPAVVEFAPLQKIPRAREKMKKDPKCGTIEQGVSRVYKLHLSFCDGRARVCACTDKDYKSFLASLEAQLPSFPTAEQRLEEIEMKEKELASKKNQCTAVKALQKTVSFLDKTTPLVEYLLRKKRQGGSRVDVSVCC